jgi:ribokinase
LSRIVVFGSINIDESTQVDHIPVTGETIVGIGSPRAGIGGKGANQAIAASVLGDDVKLVGAVGSDDVGAWAVSRLRDHRVDTAGVLTDAGATGRAIILITAEGDNAIVVTSGANATVTIPEGLDGALAEADGLLVQFELPLPAVAGAVRRAWQRGLLTVTNAAPMVAAWSDDLEVILQHSSVLIVNEIEAAQLAALAGLDAADIGVLGTALLTLGPQTVIITRGGDGVLATDADGQVAVSALSVDVVDTTGAGDACCAAITVALLAVGDLAAAIALGNAAGAHSVGRSGTAESFGSLAEIERLRDSATGN